VNGVGFAFHSIFFFFLGYHFFTYGFIMIPVSILGIGNEHLIFLHTEHLDSVYCMAFTSAIRV
jgi:hypothetical protein